MTIEATTTFTYDDTGEQPEGTGRISAAEQVEFERVAGA